MARIIIKNLNNYLLESNNSELSILKIAQEAGLDWMHACGAKGRCTTCRAEIVSGNACLSPRNACEERMLPRLSASERLTCQTRVVNSGEVVLRIPKNCQFPHIEYKEAEIQ